jgi:hypothetical protein
LRYSVVVNRPSTPVDLKGQVSRRIQHRAPYLSRNHWRFHAWDHIRPCSQSSADRVVPDLVATIRGRGCKSGVRLGNRFCTFAIRDKNELTKGSSIQVGDTVVSEDARLQLRFTDGGFVSLAPHSEFRVNAYSYSGKPDGTEHISMELLKGGLRTIDGLIGKAVQAAYELKTSVATMGIRGTEYTVVYGEGVSGTVSAGAIAVCNAGGCIDVARGQSYFVANIQTKPVYISKAAFLSPPQPAKVEQKKITRTETTVRRLRTKTAQQPVGTTPHRPNRGMTVNGTMMTVFSRSKRAMTAMTAMNR